MKNGILKVKQLYNKTKPMKKIILIAICVLNIFICKAQTTDQELQQKYWNYLYWRKSCALALVRITCDK